MIRSLVAVIVAASAAIPCIAFGIAGNLDTPGVAVPAGADLSDLNAVLRDKRFKYVGGHFINAATDLYYDGDAADLGAFLEALIACHGVTVDLQFATLRKEGAIEIASDRGLPLPVRSRWHVSHNAWADADRLTITAFLGEGGIDPTKLRLPSWRGGSSTPAPKAPDRPPASR